MTQNGTVYASCIPSSPDFYSAPVGERRIAISLSVCVFVRLSVRVSVCPRAYLWNRWTDLHEFFCADSLWPWLGPPLVVLHTLCTSGFMDDVTFGRRGRYGDAWLAALRYRGGD